MAKARFSDGLGIGILIFLLLGWTYTYDCDTPLGSAAPSVIDNRIREVKDAIQERQNIDHYWELTGTQVSHADTGKHKQVTFQAPQDTPSTVDADEAELYTKDVSSKAELHWIDEDENEIQITSAGVIVGNLTDNSVGVDEIQLANNSYLRALNNAGDGEINAIKVNTSDVLVLYDGAVLSGATESGDGARTVADKGYVDGVIASEVTMSAYTRNDSEPTYMVKDHAYLAATDGFVYAEVSLTADGQHFIGYVDTDNNPLNGQRLGWCEAGSYSWDVSMFFAVAEGEYFEITSSAGTPVIRWKSLGTLSRPVDQD